MTDKRFIEESFPVKEVSAESALEKSIRHGHISTLHIWWARRPLASSRATNYAALIPAPKDADEWNAKRNFIIDLCKWENSLNKNLMDKARKDILDAFNGEKPKVLDPFSGGGAIPLEALRLGCETYANDYNPVAVLIEKCTLEYPQKYGQKLVEDVKKWGEWVLEEARKELEQFYPVEKEDRKGYFGDSTEESIPVGYIWARTVRCQNPSCEAEIPLMRQFWLAKKPNKNVSLYPYVEGRVVKFKVVGTGYEKMPEDFDPSKGTVSRAIAECLVCGSIVEANDVRKQFREGKATQRMVAVVSYKKGEKGKKYRIATEKDIEVYQKAEQYLKEKTNKLRSEWGIEPVPDEPLPPKNTLGFRVQRYGILRWGDLFNSRQKLALITFIGKVRGAYKKMSDDGLDEDYAKAVTSYLALAVDMTSAFTNTLSRWENTSEAIKQLYSRQALPMLWDYVEADPFSGSSGSYETGQEYYIKVVKHCSKTHNTPAFISQSTATSLPYEDNFFDAVFTDPPYYDNVPYSYLSDFFYVWLKRSVSYLYPELFSTPTTPKNKEIVAYTHEQSWDEAKEFFENMLKQSFKEIHRVLKPDGIAVIVYAHKTTEGWETVINALIDSGLTVTASWPVSTEMKGRLRAQESAALASSIYIVARKIKKKETGFYPEVKKGLQVYLGEKLERLWQEGISGADFFIAAIGAGIEVFGEYKKIIDYEGNVIRADKLLEDIRIISTDFAVKQILHNGFTAEISPLTRFYVLWRWNYQEAKVPFDEARKLAQSSGVNLEKEWNKGFISKEKEFIRVIGPKERDIEELDESEELIDVLHHVLLLWEAGKKDNILKRLESSYGGSEAFYRIMQAISQTLSNESKEKKLLDGFLTGKEKIKDQIKTLKTQDKLERWAK